ncbi:hypothetical protein HanRHA438_Chr16g0749571 [Helianthus annuus]|uniref:Uncharacterized protein n=1 Tax=Helianthus annuus TaxID=4232 RepID=A0A251V688_HELAN|nr:protein SOB FIVE-LIKE 6 [Helianthus annuus]KAF5759113.1 hypothetical protein HanXRQr2_Chr16g0737301 [Helianthus annuus]KAJ0437358.1 putative SOB-five-Like (SOFL) family [Helianthus annuus]KAJ0441770.1 hypothetical protein HanIR_Chr16g0801551 [Helianthus annuus]KAJ0459673.1 putative SOB-five-Like (SOFL) family [Helianthus annuus]KAJ0640154.1 putative SOB-five-Like (SOFL) family [Helianthus annuus]
MEQVFGSESSSGCESGWTLYLEHSQKSHKNEDDFVCKNASFSYEVDEEQEEEEDMSMVSDASSGPQHFPEQEDECFKFNNGGAYTNGKTRKNLNIPKESQQKPSFLDDTASSPFFNFSNNNLTVPTNKASSNDIIDYSQGYSTTYFKEESAFEDHLGFFHPISGAQLQQNQWLEDKRWA